MSNCRIGRIVTMTSLAELADVKLPPAGIYYAVSCVWMGQWHP
jgi:hypothetical protein